MIIKYVRERGYEGNGKDPHFTLSKEYIVLGVSFDPSSYVHYSIIQADSDDYPVLLEIKYFDIVDSRIPEGWIFRDSGEGYFELQPQEFCDNFWDDFHDGKEEAEKVYRDVVNKIYAFHGMEPFYKPEPPKPEPLKENEWWKEYDEEGNKKPSNDEL